MRSNDFVPPAQYYATLPAVHVSAGVLLTDPADRVLLVKPNYRPHWAFPGGIADDGEAPHHCAQREAAEETGLTVAPGLLLVVDWAPAAGDRHRPIMNFLFDAGTADPDDIVVQDTELDDVAFFDWDAAPAHFPANTAARIPAARQARKDARTIYLPSQRA
ncbi:NUDIX domain-containing protein [Actinomadura fibrosa]|uniref:NUDIX domain-containing protein n=1 Tax=Actinomadura fibrosa TaxID=111802 RepID=A0ABW2XYN6_9ACTN|nr:NUDIX hydrolase [Actinomadura fibrosa]